MFRKALLWVTVGLVLGFSSTNAQVHASDTLDTSRTTMYGLEEFVPTAFHRTIYHMMEICTGIYRESHEVRWYIAKSIIWRTEDTEEDYLGVWFDSWGWGVLVFEREYVFDGKIVSHEVLHDIYQGQAPMDIAMRCILEWENLTPIHREESSPDERPSSNP